MVKISNASHENEIHMVDSPFNEDSKIYSFFGQEGPNLENLEKMAKTGKPNVMQIREW